MFKEDLKEIICTSEEIDETCIKLASELEKELNNLKEIPVFLGLLKGCNPFMSELITKIPNHLEVDYMDVSSYFGGIKSTDQVTIVRDMTVEVKDRHIYIIEDIVESGKTIEKVKELLLFRGAKSVKIVTFLDKPSGRKVELKPEFIGVTVPDSFLIGYGLDYKELYRNMHMIGIPKDEVIEEIDEK